MNQKLHLINKFIKFQGQITYFKFRKVTEYFQEAIRLGFPYKEDTKKKLKQINNADWEKDRENN